MVSISRPRTADSHADATAVHAAGETTHETTKLTDGTVRQLSLKPAEGLSPGRLLRALCAKIRSESDGAGRPTFNRRKGPPLHPTGRKNRSMGIQRTPLIPYSHIFSIGLRISNSCLNFTMLPAFSAHYFRNRHQHSSDKRTDARHHG
jgi:hypothetical protein